ncbi:hypothetical protein JRO89_XS01G0117000 [Xanthoceras sorbifolium]|uniref:protein acetyllysine N-acetyltransferase n=1 Tax=Xanthoceras sorbifolium TaxID=99658 RepID=A0ABQ8IIW6_9ROSI|nr:hypothetical protein JRO89_XS01G0117000 [Xanthoceras sorbifolium]
MSLGYAKKLSYREDVGSVGMSEIFDQPHVLQQKVHSILYCFIEMGDIEELAAIIKESKHLVAFTGAGISTSCGIPDFRGPKGVWTLQSEGKDVPEASVPFHCAMPSITHMALVELEKAGILKFVISQIETIGMKKTPRRCADVQCGDRLRDTVVDWEGALPPKEMNLAAEQCRMADVVLCLGTSLQISPACNLPLKSLRGGGKIVIVNLQPTAKDNKASLVIHGLVDKVISGLIHHLDLRIPPHVRVDLVQISLTQFRSSQSEKYIQWSLKIGSVFGIKAPLPWIKSVEVSFIATPNLKKAVYISNHSCSKGSPVSEPLGLQANPKQKWELYSCAVLEFPVNFEERADSISHDKDAVIQQLRDAAIENQCCGQSSLVERKQTHSTSPEKEVSVFAVSTNLVRYDSLLVERSGLSDDIPKNNDSPVRKLNDNVMPPKKRKFYGPTMDR